MKKAYIDVEIFTYRHACNNEYEYELKDGIWSYYCQIEDAKFGVDEDLTIWSNNTFKLNLKVNSVEDFQYRFFKRN